MLLSSWEPVGIVLEPPCSTLKIDKHRVVSWKHIELFVFRLLNPIIRIYILYMNIFVFIYIYIYVFVYVYKQWAQKNSSIWDGLKYVGASGLISREAGKDVAEIMCSVSL